MKKYFWLILLSLMYFVSTGCNQQQKVDEELNKKASEGYNDWESPGPVHETMPSIKKSKD